MIPHDELPHRGNILAKRTSRKYVAEKHQALLAEIEPREMQWHKANEEITGTDYAAIKAKVDLLNPYKDFLDQQMYAEGFDSRSRLHSSALEQFCYYLFRDVVKEVVAEVTAKTGKPVEPLIGDGTAVFEDMHFAPSGFAEMLIKPSVRVKTKDHDFVVGQNVLNVLFNVRRDGTLFDPKDESRSHQTLLKVPAVVIECKTYLDRTMLDGAAYSAMRLKASNPHCMFILVAEYLKLNEEENPRLTKLDEIYILRKQINTDREFRFDPQYVKKPIDILLVWDLFETVRKHLRIEWGAGTDALERGKLIGMDVADVPENEEE